MQVEFIMNGSVSLILSPENAAEEALLKQLVKQNNDIIEIRSRITVVNKSFSNGVIIGKKELGRTNVETPIDTNEVPEEKV
jgi:hypothetical protein